jgi:hypothetical protein
MGHFYGRDGTPQYFVNGRDSTLRDARKFGWVPSVTEILQVIAKPALTDWKVAQGIMAALTLPKTPGESDEDYIARITQDSRQQAIDAANEGTRIHDACEQWFRDKVIVPGYERHVEGVRKVLAETFPHVDDWVAEESFAHPLGYGGKVDLHSKSTGIVVDFKGKDGDFTETDKYGKQKKLAWDQHYQLAPYQVGLGLCEPNPSHQLPNGFLMYPVPNFVQCANIFVSRTHPGAVKIHVWAADEIADGWSVFEASLQLWKRIKKYDAGWVA